MLAILAGVIRFRAMSREGRDLLIQALELPSNELAWASEIQKRVAAARAGELASTDWRTVLDRVERAVLGR
jgi:hypothetical protein